MKFKIILIYLILLNLASVGQENLIIDKIRMQGNNNIPTPKLKEQIIMEPDSWFKKKILKKEPVFFMYSLYNDDLERIRNLYQREGYLNVEFKPPVVIVNKKNKVELTFIIEENQPVSISDISFLVDSVSQLEEVLKRNYVRKIELQTKAAKDETFRDETITNDRLVIADAFYEQGYPYTKVEPKLDVDTSSNSTKIKWMIDRGPLSYFGETNVVGNERVPTKSILKQLSYEKGDVWSKKKIGQSQELIYNQGNYRVASVRTQLAPARTDTLPVIINIKEAPRWSTRFGVGYGREDKLRAFADVQYLSFLTNTGRLNFYTKHSGLEPYNLYLKFSQPSFLFKFNTATLYPYMLRQNEPGYKLDKWGVNLTFLQNFSKELSTSIGYVFEDIKVDTTGIIGDKTTPDGESTYRKSGIVMGAIYNNSEPVLDPVQGYVLSFNTKTNGLFGKREMPFVRLIGEFKTYVGVSRGVTLAFKAKMGGILRTDNYSFIPVEERFFAGGSYSVRGWARSELGPKDENGAPVGGNSLFESSAEFRFDLGRRFRFSAFVDGGNVWLDPFSYKFNDLRYSTGVGFYIDTPIGPAGLDFARPVFDTENKWQIHINIGHTF